jgi:hypothetical protein
MSDSFRPISKCCPADPREWIADTVAEVTSWTRALRIAGYTMTRIAVSIGCSEDSLRAWRDGEVSMPVVKWKALRALHGDVMAKRRVG